MARTKGKRTAQQLHKRAEYTRLRDIARKRILRAQAKGELLDTELPPKLADIKNTRQLDKELAKIKKFLNSPFSTAKGREEQKKKRFEGYKRAGYTNINEKNENLFKEFMKHMTRVYTTMTPDGKRMFHDSDTFVEFFDQMVEEDRINDKTRLSDLVRMFNKWVGMI